MKEFAELSRPDTPQSIQDRFEAIVRIYPDRLAVKAGERFVGYDELNRTANRIARAILQRGGARSALVALEFEHGVDVIAAMLGALKAGKYFVALDPSLPLERKNYILQDSQARLILANSSHAEVVRKTRGVSALLNTDEIGASFSSDNLGAAISPDDLAILTYTSGSTGEPKGVARSHRSFLHSSVINAEEMRVGPDDRLSLFHSPSFASAYTHLFTSLLYGASLFPFDIKSEGPHGLANWLRQERITVCHLPLAVFRQLADSLPGREDISTLRLLHLSGAPITKRDFDLYKKTFSPETLLSISMGSTETRGICFAIVDQNFSFPAEGSPVGYPRPGKEVFLLDENGKTADPGEVGEIAVKDRNLSPGYWKKPGLTRSKFIPDPRGGDELVYLTGDLGRMMPDGFVIHLGRKDLMVKIRGYRVELSEIENTLRAHPRIKEAAVAACDREDGEKQLAAYVVSADEPPPTTSELRDFLRGRLPDYMLPAGFMFLESLPLTNGKLDRAALPPPDDKRPSLTQPYAPPRDEIEKTLVRIWEEVLKLQPIGIDDSFFDLGGHSLHATKLFARLDHEFGRRLTLRVLFAAPSVRLIAEWFRSPAKPL